MAKKANDTPQRRPFDMRELGRVALWGAAATGALTIAVFASSTDVGTDRLMLAVAQIRGIAEPPTRQAARSPNDGEARRLAEAVRLLAADRERLVARLTTLERGLEDVTGSNARPSEPVAATAAPQQQPQPAPVIAPVASVPAAPARPPNVWASLPLPQPRVASQAPPQAAPVEAEPVATRTEFGIDLGGASTVDGLRTLWTAAKNKHGNVLDGLRPIVTVRENSRPGAVGLRLVAGPLANAAAAARLCAALTAANAICQPAVFEGQRLAAR